MKSNGDRQRERERGSRIANPLKGEREGKKNGSPTKGFGIAYCRA